ncbi:MAG: hypothetical protein ACRCYO_13820, partial [Bacteroidia bacterium]
KTYKELRQQTEDENGLLMLRGAKKAGETLFAAMIFMQLFFPLGIILLIVGLIQYSQIKRQVFLQPELYSEDNVKLMNQAMLAGLLAGLLTMLLFIGVLVILSTYIF